MAKCVKCGKKGLFLKINESGLCESCETALKYTSQIEKLQKEKQEVENLLTPEMKDCIKLKKTINEYTNSISDLKLQMQNLKDEISKFESQHKQLKMQLIHDEEAIELEDFSLYKPFYDFANSDNYKEKLQEIRNKQKDMIKQKIATICSTNWTVD